MNILLTGASSGIGLATALEFARSGDRVYAGVRAPNAAIELRRAVQSESLPVIVLRLDVDNPESVRRCVADVITGAGTIDVLVNNAGIGGGGPIEEASLDVAQRLFETNYFGCVRMIQAVLPGMRERRSGAIINVSSIMGRMVFAAHGHYCAAKHALEAMSEALAQEVQRYGIRVVVIEPGVVSTPIFAKNVRQVEPSSPYLDHTRRLVTFFRNRLQHASTPSIVATTIREAVIARVPRFRYVIGSDAESLLIGRRFISDEEWIAEGSPMEDDEWMRLMHQRYGIDLRDAGPRPS